MPVPGPDFLRLAQTLGDEPARTKTDKKIVAEGAYIRALYALALYCDWFTLPVRLKNNSVNVRFIPGHPWGVDKPAGPRTRANVLVLGKMPGKEEVQRGRNFYGPSGQLLEDALILNGYHDYEKWYMTNIMKFGHPNPWAGNSVPKDWYKDCRILVQQELRIVLPDYILCLGSEAGKELLGQQGTVTASAGKVFDYKLDIRETYDEQPRYHMIKIMTCVHPAAVARSPELGSQFNESIGLFVRLVQGESVGQDETDIEHVVVDDATSLAREVDRAIAETPNGAAIAIDCEWHGEYPDEPGSWLRTIQVSHRGKYACCIVLRRQGGLWAFRPGPEEALKELRRLFKSTPERPVRAVGHFHRADLPWLKHFGLDLTEQFSVPADPNDGWLRTKNEGGFDTGMAAHSVRETDDFKLEVQATRLTSVPRYDMELQKWKKSWCALNKKKEQDLGGYGFCPDEILHPYSLYDADSTRRLFDIYNGVGSAPGRLDYDDYGNNCRMAFWISMRASPACHEIEETGLMIDMNRAEDMIRTYRVAKAEKIQELRQLIRWPGFKPSSPFDCRELLFGPRHRGQDKKVSPDDAILCNLEPVKATGKQTKTSWSELETRGEAKFHSPSTDKEVLGILANQHPEFPAIRLLRDIKFLQKLLETTLRPPINKAGVEIFDAQGKPLYEKGLLSYVCSDSRIRTHLYQTLESGRYASARPNLQNIGKRREADYARILGKELYKYPLRSMFVAPPGYALIEADYVGAELAAMAWMSGDPQMIEHIRRAQLPENHPDYYDIHSAVAVAAFRLKCPATKAGLESIGMIHLRVAAKNVIFGRSYGRGAAAIQRQCKEEGVDISLKETQELIAGIDNMYPELFNYFGRCKDRVSTPGWLCNALGRFRRFSAAIDSKIQSDQEREAANFEIQSLIADAVSRALDYLYSWPGRTYRIGLQIHDAVLLIVPIPDLEYVYDVVIPTCMTKNVPIWPTDLDGNVLPRAKPHYLGVDIEVTLRWGSKLDDAALASQLGIPARFVKPKKKK